MSRAAAALAPQVLAARAFKLAITLVRGSGLLPKSIPDGRGDESQLALAPPQAEVIVYFADTVNGLYQLRPWYKALRALHRVHRLVIVGTDSRAVKTIRRESHLPAYTISHYSSIDLILAKSPVRLALYINHNAANFSMLAFPQLTHVSIMHGDSDKVVSVSGQTKAYDFTFVAGQAAVDRLAANLPLFDAPARCVIIGRPQVDFASPAEGDAGTGGTASGDKNGGRRVEAGRPKEVLPGGGDAGTAGAASGDKNGGRRTVLYAPTWEGGTDSAAYSSLAAHGAAIAGGLLADGRFRVVYRPHPLTGTRVPDFAAADARVRQMVAAAAKAEPGAGHRVSLGGDAGDELRRADLLICDVSSLAIDFLVTGRPLTITVPPDGQAVVAPTPLLELTPRLGPEQVRAVGDFVAGLAAEDTGRSDRAALAEYYLGDTRPGAATALFIEACGRMIALTESNQAKLAAARGGPERGAP
ncbi:MAG: CDP-glycerol glycerophosphotransferase family protein [Bifidobacteriaceae bacterium]|jgi:hypothetical protein|nr:CDP-glycerol glycerophosphotransferase family protein [Bifidobacteriaceae bacterium]